MKRTLKRELKKGLKLLKRKRSKEKIVRCDEIINRELDGTEWMDWVDLV